MTRPSFAARMGTLLIALLFVSGNFGLATADGLLNHLGRPSATATAPHIETDRGCGVHAEHCALETLVAQQHHGAVPIAAAPPAHVAELWRDLPPSVVVAPTPVDLRAHQPRAPPTLLAL